MSDETVEKHGCDLKFNQNKTSLCYSRMGGIWEQCMFFIERGNNGGKQPSPGNAGGDL